MPEFLVKQRVIKPLTGSITANGSHPALRRSYAILKGMPQINPIPSKHQVEPNPWETLLQQITEGDDAALGKLYDASISRVYGLAMKITLRSELAEEVVSDVYLQVWKKAAMYNPKRASPIAWLMLICRSRAIDLLRREQRAKKGREPIDDKREIPDEKTGTPLDASLKSEFGGQMKKALQALPEIQRQMIALAYFRGMSHQEVATFTNQPLGTVKSHLRRAQMTLRKVLTTNGLNREAYCE